LGLLAITATIGAADFALAADFGRGPPIGVPVLRAPSAIVAANWDGFYIGGNIGGGVSSGSYTLNNGAFSENFNFDPATFVGGGQMGVQAQWGHWVFGVEGGYTFSWYDQTLPSVVAPANLSTVDVKYLGNISGKLGFAEGAWMVYGKAGWAFGRIHNFYQNNAAGTTIDFREWNSGYTLGLGFDYQFAPGWVAGFGFDYYSFSPSYNFIVGGIANGDVNLYTFTARVSYLFNWWR
jgi:outer membrane immunogenic protein